MQNILFFLQVFVFQSDCLNINRREKSGVASYCRHRELPNLNQLPGQDKNSDAAIFWASETWSDKYQISIMSCEIFRLNKSLSDESVHCSVWPDDVVLQCGQTNMFSCSSIFKGAASRCTERDIKTRRLYRLSLNRGNSVAIIQRMKENLTQIKISRGQAVLGPAGICLSKLRSTKLSVQIS